MPKGKPDRFAKHAPGQRDKCKFAAIVDELPLADKADVIEALEKYAAPTIARGLEKEFDRHVSEEVVRRHMNKRCACVR